MKSNKTNPVTDVTDHFDIKVTCAHARTRGEPPKQPVTSVTPDTRSIGPAPANCMLGRKLPPPYEIEAVKRYGWRDQGILVVNTDDRRLQRNVAVGRANISFSMRSKKSEMHRNQPSFRIFKKSTMLKAVHRQGETHASSTAASSWCWFQEHCRAAT